MGGLADNSYAVTTKNETLFAEGKGCQDKLHKWGRANRVAFDPTKEHVAILHPLHGSGDPFKLLGCMVDNKLLMHVAVDKIHSQMRPKL